MRRSRLTVLFHVHRLVLADFCARMEGFTFSLRLGGRIVGRVAAELDPLESLARARGTASSLVLAFQQPLRRQWSDLSSNASTCRKLDRGCRKGLGTQGSDQTIHGDCLGKNRFSTARSRICAPCRYVFILDAFTQLFPISCGAQCSFLVCRMHLSHDKSQCSAGSWYSCCSDIRCAAIQVTLAHETLLQQQQHCVSLRSF